MLHITTEVGFQEGVRSLLRTDFGSQILTLEILNMSFRFTCSIQNINSNFDGNRVQTLMLTIIETNNYVV